jgi:hypothetical protein
MKRAVEKSLRHISTLEEATFYNVPIFVDDDFPARSGARVSVADDDRRVGLGGDVAKVMDREIAKQWLIDFMEKERTVSSLTHYEIHGLMLVLEVSKTEVAKLLRVAKGSVTRYVDGSLKPTAPTAQLMLIFLAAELAKPGTAKKLLQEHRTLITGALSLKVPTPNFTIKQVA